MPEDVNLSHYTVTYFNRHGEERKDPVSGHNDCVDEETGYYTIWRYMPNGERVNAFRCRLDAWESTAASDSQAEVQELRRANAELQDSVHIAHATAAQAENRVQELASRLAKLEGPSPQDVPF